MKSLRQSIEESLNESIRIGEIWKSITDTVKSIFKKTVHDTLSVRVMECDVHKRSGKDAGSSVIHADLFNDPLRLTQELNRYISSNFKDSISKTYKDRNIMGDDWELVDVFNSTVYVFNKDIDIDSTRNLIVDEFNRLVKKYCRESKRDKDVVTDNYEIHSIEVMGAHDDTGGPDGGLPLYPTLSLMW